MYRSSSSKQAGAKASFTSTKHKSEQAGSSIDAIVYCVQAKLMHSGNFQEFSLRLLVPSFLV